jgi:3,4-dihydroxy 2-butanone 4-phosphate synthase/GTP cyclohydrolase II
MRSTLVVSLLAAASLLRSPHAPPPPFSPRPPLTHRSATISPTTAAASPPTGSGGASSSSAPSPSSTRVQATAALAAARPTTSTPAPPPSLPPPAPGFDTIPDAIAAIAAGAFVVVLDDADRENEGDLILAADAATPAALAFMVEHTSGVVCVGLPGPACDALALPLMVPPAANEDAMRTAFTVTVDAAAGITTGISAADRARTIRLLGGWAAGGGGGGTAAADLRRPGHVFPLRAHPGGVRARPGHTEAAVELASLAGRSRAGVLCEIVDRRDGSMARTPALLAFARAEGLKCVTIADLVAYMDAVEGK